MGRTFKRSVELKIRFFGIWIHSEAFSGLRNLFCGFCKDLIFLEYSTQKLDTQENHFDSWIRSDFM